MAVECQDLGVDPSSSSSDAAFWSLGEDGAECWVILVFVDVVNSNMSVWVSVCIKYQ